jgi:hypothetical protein
MLLMTKSIDIFFHHFECISFFFFLGKTHKLLPTKSPAKKSPTKNNLKTPSTKSSSSKASPTKSNKSKQAPSGGESSSPEKKVETVDSKSFTTFSENLEQANGDADDYAKSIGDDLKSEGIIDLTIE